MLCPLPCYQIISRLGIWAFSSVKGLCMYVLYVLYIYLVRHREKPYPILRATLV